MSYLQSRPGRLACGLFALLSASSCGALRLAVDVDEIEVLLDAVPPPTEPERAPGFEEFFTTPTWQVGEFRVWTVPTQAQPSGNIVGAVHVECLGVRTARSQFDGSWVNWEFPYQEWIPIEALNSGGALFAAGPSSLAPPSPWAQSVSAEVRPLLEQWIADVNRRFAAKHPGAVATGRIVQDGRVVFLGKKP